MTKTYDYVIRVSSLGDRKADETDTIPDQEARSLAEIARHGAQVGKRIDAVNMSGGIVLESPAYAEAMARIERGQSQGIVTAYSSRFARNHWAMGGFVDRLSRFDADLWFADRPDADYRTMTGQMMFGMDSISNEAYLAETKTKGEVSLRRKMTDGIATQVPFGYRRRGGDGAKAERLQLVPDDRSADVVRDIFARRARGESWVAIADAADLPVPSVRSIVRNEAYLGTVVVHRRKHRRGPRTGEVLRHEGAHEALVSRSVWKAAQSASTVQRNGKYAAGVAGGLARCSGCGQPLSVSGSEPYLVYACRRQRSRHCRAPVHVTKRAVDDLVDAEVVALLTHRMGTAPETQLHELLAGEADALAELEAYVENESALGALFERGLTVRQERYDQAREAREAEEDKVGASHDLPEPEAYRQLGVAGRRRIAASLIMNVMVGPRVKGGAPADRVTIGWR